MKTNESQQHIPNPHVVSMSDRKSLSASGVLDVESFDGLTVILYTELGELTVKGRALRICRFSNETGDLTLEGDIDSLVYAEMRVRSHSLLGKLFR